jgi:2-dehydro-3-deoxygalactonokinase
MPSSELMDRAAIFVDLGTTNCRAWIIQGEKVLARGHAAIGVRDRARERSPHRLHAKLRALVELLARQANVNPSFVLAAGMIGSSLGLAEVPHVPAPAGLAELAAGTRRHDRPEVTPLPVYIVPGVRTGELSGDLAGICNADVMRGEETLCLGLAELAIVHGPATVLNLGSHWKLISIDGQNRVAGSVTSLSGELIHAAQMQTILSSSVPRDRPVSLDDSWVDAGRREQARSGLPRAMFCVRLLELAEKGTPEQRMSFLVGAFIAADSLRIVEGSAVAIVGTHALASAWRHTLSRCGISAIVVDEDQSEQALLAGLRKIAAAHHQLV